MAIGASAAVNCHPCMEIHLAECDRLGLDREEVKAAVEVGMALVKGAAANLRQVEMSGCILGHINRLPERQRAAVLLHHFAGLEHRDIAAALAVSQGNARVILHRGLAALRDGLGRECRLDFSDDVPCERR